MEGDTTGNIGGRDPFLGPLQDNGGATQTHALLPDSPAIDAGRKDDLNWDQRGVARDLDARDIANAKDGSDIGAFEFEPETSDTEGSDGGGISTQLSIQADADGEVILALDGSAAAAWILQASADFDSWETLAVLPKGQTTFHDAELTGLVYGFTARSVIRGSEI